MPICIIKHTDTRLSGMKYGICASHSLPGCGVEERATKHDGMASMRQKPRTKTSSATSIAYATRSRTRRHTIAIATTTCATQIEMTQSTMNTLR
jgi:hypothetical protein